MSKKGFTIIESLIAIAVLVTVVMGTMAVVQTGISSYIYSKDQIVAFYLAQEGFEQIRNLRDENRLKNLHWLAGISQQSSDPCYFSNACYVDVVANPVPIRCGASGCPVLRQSATGYFGYDLGWSPSKFTRVITLRSINEDEIAITVEVSWVKGIVSREFKARENLLNW
jgi:prepilin-type N-terminal cleavage/methylation domain-containing protein